MTETLTTYAPIIFQPKVEKNVEVKKQSFFTKLVNKYADYKFKKMEKKGKFEQYCVKKNKKWMKRLPKFLKWTSEYETIGLENLASLENTGFIAAPNHKSAFDPFYAGAGMNRLCFWVSKYENSKGLFGLISRGFGTMFLNKSRKWTKKSKKQALDHLKNKQGVGIFPEGTRNKNGLGYFHKGPAKLCLEAQVPYLPIAIIGSAKPFKGKTIIVYGKPNFSPIGLENNYENAVKITKNIRQDIENLLFEFSAKV